MLRMRRPVAWALLLAWVVLLVTCVRVATAQPAPDTHVEARVDAVVCATAMNACATGLRNCAAELERVPDPPSRIVWLVTGLAAGLIIGAVALEPAR